MRKSNPLRTVLSVAACKLTRTVLRKTGRGGTAIPGIVAIKVDPGILTAVSRDMQTVVVTGTNGKTTICNMTEHAVTACGFRCRRDRSGANLLHGIASDLICNADWRGRPRCPYAVIECDEAALKQVAEYITPAAIVVTNLFSDQVDRYGSVRNTLEEIRAGVEKCPSSTLVLNADEPLSASLSLHVPNKIVWYGMNRSVGTRGTVDLSDAGVCPECGSAYEYDWHIYAHLGGFRCPKCGWQQQSPDVEVLSIDRTGPDGSIVQMQIGKNRQEVHIALPAVYNVYNAAAAIAASAALGLPEQKAAASLSDVRPSFGRMETFDLSGVRVQMILVKNPAGCNQAFTYVTSTGEDYTAVLLLNNRTGDGLDYSWIETTDYEKLCADPHLQQIYVGGDRAQDLYDRLLRAGARKEQLTLTNDYPALVRQLAQEGRPVYIMPNYTGMMDLRPALCKATGTGDFWE